MNKTNKLRHALLNLVLLLLMSNTGWSQQGNPTVVTGTVMNEKGDLLSGVTVQAKKAGTEDIAQSVTDDKGIFTLERIAENASYEITVTSIGYQSTVLKGFRIKPGKNNSILIKLRTALCSWKMWW